MMNLIMGFGMPAVWLAAFVVFLIIEGIVPGLVSIWFAVGALAAFISALCNAPLWLQILWFVIISVTALLLTRPLAKKYVNGRAKPTNADAVIGRDCIVTEKVDNLLGTGAAKIAGREWTARAEEEKIGFDIGEKAEIVRIEGVKLIIRKTEQ